MANPYKIHAYVKKTIWLERGAQPSSVANTFNLFNESYPNSKIRETQKEINCYIDASNRILHSVSKADAPKLAHALENSGHILKLENKQLTQNLSNEGKIRKKCFEKTIISTLTISDSFKGPNVYSVKSYTQPRPFLIRPQFSPSLKTIAK